jgi:hypothetical protein
MESRTKVRILARLLDHVDERLHFDGVGPAFPPARVSTQTFMGIAQGLRWPDFLLRVDLAVPRIVQLALENLLG